MMESLASLSQSPTASTRPPAAGPGADLNLPAYYAARVSALRSRAARARDPDIARLLSDFVAHYERLLLSTSGPDMPTPLHAERQHR